MQAVIDQLPENVKLILCGSYITIMKELLAEDNPLFGRFPLIQHIHDFDYYEASQFYPNLSVREKVAFYFNRPMTLAECGQEKEQLKHTQGIDASASAVDDGAEETKE